MGAIAVEPAAHADLIGRVYHCGGQDNAQQSACCDIHRADTERPCPDSQRSVDRWFDTSAFVALSNTPGAVGFVPNRIIGNSGVGILRGPGLVNLDFNLSKEFPIHEQVSAQFRAEFFNSLNHTNLGVPGIMIGGGFGQIVSAADARIIQFALKLYF